jgi:SAM-dependent methyltransferase
MTASGAADARKQALRDHADRLASEAGLWRARNSYFHDCDIDYLRFLLPKGASVLELGCGAGDLLAALTPARGVGVDLSERMVTMARARHPDLEFVVGDVEDPAVLEGLGGPFDVILLSDTVGALSDVQATLEGLHGLCDRDTRLIVAYYSHLWEPVLKGAESLRLKMPQVEQNYLRLGDILNLLELAGFDPVKQEQRLLLPKRLFGLGTLVNRWIGPFPGFRRLCLRHYTVARSLRHAPRESLSATVVIPCRNERGNIKVAIDRLRPFCDDLEVIFVEGHSSDGTLEEIERVIAAYDGPMKLRHTVQDGIGKADAVWKAFDMATGDLLMILDADLTVGPEMLERFYRAVLEGRGEFINGSRLVYPMEEDAMRFLNFVGNAFFARCFSWLLNQRITDTLCGTKVLTRAHYARLKAGRSYFGDFDPFGDFDLIFGAAKLNLKFLEVPIRYASRLYGETQIQRFRHGIMLFRMVAFAYRKLKAL